MYPGSQFKDKQESENRDKQRDADKIRDKFEKFGFSDIPLGAQGTWREGYIASLIEAKKNGLELPVTYKFSNTFVPASAEEFIEHIKPLVAEKMKELEQSDFFKAAPAVDTPMTEEADQAQNAEKTDETAIAEVAAKPKKKKNKNKKTAAAVVQQTSSEEPVTQPVVKEEPVQPPVQNAAQMFEGDDEKEDVDMETQEIELTEE